MGRRKMSMLFRWIARNGALVWMVGAFALSPGVLQAQEVPKTCPAEPTDMAIGYGDSVACAIEIVGDLDLFRFSGTNGEKISIQATRQDGSIFPCIELFRPNGSLRTSACSISLVNRMDIELDIAGTHTLRVADRSNSYTGNYLLTLNRFFPLAIDADAMGYGDSISTLVDYVGDIDLYYFPASLGDGVSIQATRQDGSIFPCIELLKPDGSLLQSACEIALNNRIDIELDAPGSYGIRLSDRSNSYTGKYLLTNNCIAGPCNTFPDLLVPSRLANMSTRGKAGVGDEVMIAGFIIGGDTSVTLLIRGRGPSVNLPVGAVKLPNPYMKLFSGQTLIGENDDWQDAPNADAIEATGKAPPNALESAILVTLPPGPYTAQLSDADGNAGVGIVEVIVIND